MDFIKCITYLYYNKFDLSEGRDPAKNNNDIRFVTTVFEIIFLYFKIMPVMVVMIFKRLVLILVILLLSLLNVLIIVVLFMSLVNLN